MKSESTARRIAKLTSEDSTIRQIARMTTPKIGRAQRVRLEPGDIVVLETDVRLGGEQHEHIHRNWKRITGSEVVVLDGGLKLRAVLGSESVLAVTPAYEVPAVPL